MKKRCSIFILLCLFSLGAMAQDDNIESIAKQMGEQGYGVPAHLDFGTKEKCVGNKDVAKEYFLVPKSKIVADLKEGDRTTNKCVIYYDDTRYYDTQRGFEEKIKFKYDSFNESETFRFYRTKVYGVDFMIGRVNSPGKCLAVKNETTFDLTTTFEAEKATEWDNLEQKHTQLWGIQEDGNTGFFYIQSLTNGNFLTLTTNARSLTLAPANDKDNNSQLFAFLPKSSVSQTYMQLTDIVYNEAVKSKVSETASKGYGLPSSLEVGKSYYISRPIILAENKVYSSKTNAYGDNNGSRNSLLKVAKEDKPHLKFTLEKQTIDGKDFVRLVTTEKDSQKKKALRFDLELQDIDANNLAQLWGLKEVTHKNTYLIKPVGQDRTLDSFGSDDIVLYTDKEKPEEDLTKFFHLIDPAKYDQLKEEYIAKNLVDRGFEFPSFLEDGAEYYPVFSDISGVNFYKTLSVQDKTFEYRKEAPELTVKARKVKKGNANFLILTRMKDGKEYVILPNRDYTNRNPEFNASDIKLDYFWKLYSTGTADKYYMISNMASNFYKGETLDENGKIAKGNTAYVVFKKASDFPTYFTSKMMPTINANIKGTTGLPSSYSSSNKYFFCTSYNYKSYWTSDVIHSTKVVEAKGDEMLFVAPDTESNKPNVYYTLREESYGGKKFVQIKSNGNQLIKANNRPISSTNRADLWEFKDAGSGKYYILSPFYNTYLSLDDENKKIKIKDGSPSSTDANKFHFKKPSDWNFSSSDKRHVYVQLDELICLSDVESGDCEPYLQIKLKKNGGGEKDIRRLRISDSSGKGSLAKSSRLVQYRDGNGSVSSLYLGEFSKSDNIELSFFLWECDGCGDSWTYNTCTWGNDDDDHGTTSNSMVVKEIFPDNQKSGRTYRKANHNGKWEARYYLKYNVTK